MSERLDPVMPDAAQATDTSADAEPHAASRNGAHAAPKGKYLAYLALGALGVVYGDIGTSPLYAFRESFHANHDIAITPANILGVLSLIF